MATFARAAVAALAVSLIAGPAAAQPETGPSLSSPLYVVVPFGEPGDTDPQLPLATKSMTQDLSGHSIRSALANPVDAVEAVSAAPQLCSEFSAAGIIVTQLRFEQSKERNLTGFIPVVGGVISSSGAFDASPIRSRVKMYLISCSGKVVWKTMTTANKVHHGQNVAAGLTEIADEAIAAAVDEFANRRSQRQAQ